MAWRRASSELPSATLLLAGGEEVEVDDEDDEGAEDSEAHEAVECGATFAARRAVPAVERTRHATCGRANRMRTRISPHKTTSTD